VNIAVVVYSESGNTRRVAERVRSRLLEKDHTVQYLELQTGTGRRELVDEPSVEGYDMICLGAPVHHLAVAKPMKLFLRSIQALHGRTVAYFVTQGQPVAALGGTQAMRTLKRMIATRAGVPVRAGIVRVNRKQSEHEVQRIVDTIEASAG